ncbi:hypothetical protein [Salimicrobium humidisoli]|uniref:Uncharacterized protein n=1 Tax=Salimicrobium humidisoli TaxID=2029857 RepID=A0ABX4HRB3_9BACI|nr:hypothetical protein [Salimicrobium humidisoli]PBB05738.1 hypothetical protein CKW00_06985 [Salimicrobium humidisoli]
MKCIETHRTYYAGSYARAELFTRKQNGKPRRLISTDKPPTLRINTKGYKLKTTEGEVIGRGKSRQPRQIVEELARRGLNVKPRIEIDTPQEQIKTSYERFIEEYGGAQMPEKRRYFKAFIYREEAAGETAIGLIEYQRRKTLAIGSFYVAENLSDRKAYGEVARYIEAQLNEGEHGIIKYARQLPSPAQRLFTDRMTFKYEGKQKRSMAEVKALAEDAIERRGSIETTFNEPLPSGAGVSD